MLLPVDASLQPASTTSRRLSVSVGARIARYALMWLAAPRPARCQPVRMGQSNWNRSSTIGVSSSDAHPPPLEDPDMRPAPPFQSPVALAFVPGELFVYVTEPAGLNLGRSDHTNR